MSTKDGEMWRPDASLFGTNGAGTNRIATNGAPPGASDVMNEEAKSRTLRDYITVLRRRKLVIVAITLIGALAALAFSLTQENVYRAEASISIKDQEEQLGIGGIPPTQGDFPAQTAARGAETVTSASVLNSVIRRLDLDTTSEELRTSITATPDKESNLVTITAEADNGRGAAELANAVAAETVNVATESLRAAYKQQAAALRAEIDQIEGLNLAELDPQEIAALTPDERQALADQATQRRTLSEKAGAFQVLSVVAAFGEITERAFPPSDPAAPKPAQNAVLGGFLGLVIALILTAVMESLDRRLRRPEEARELLQLPVVGVVPNEAMGGVPISGAPAAEHIAAMDTFRMLRTNIGYLNVDNPPQTVLVTSPVPEEGKTTAALGLAIAGAASGRRTLLIEADLHRPVHAQRLGLKSEPGLTDYLTGEASPRDVLQVREFVDPAVSRRNGTEPAPCQLACVTAGSPTGWSAEILGSARFANFIRQVGSVYDLVVVDTAPLLAVAETSQIAPLMDAVILCVRLGRTTVEEAMAGRSGLDRLPTGNRGLVIAGVSGDSRDGYSYYSYAYTYRFGQPTQERRFGRVRSRVKERA